MGFGMEPKHKMVPTGPSPATHGTWLYYLVNKPTLDSAQTDNPQIKPTFESKSITIIENMLRKKMRISCLFALLTTGCIEYGLKIGNFEYYERQQEQNEENLEQQQDALSS